ncbi:carbohydrate-binding protein [Peterkaempfera sp. SMS 1(5)a]|uniref:carbohydrate-binding protein n=1 Tax=Peterkaempfera podocarpi TaxID=3232308 RepID=UPI003671F2D8
MTAGSNGVPEDDDPFAYLYRPAGGDAGGPGVDSGAPTAVQQPGVPRTSYTQPTQVGRAQYGQRPPAQPGYGPTVPPQQAPYAQHSRPQSGAEEYPGHGGRAASRGAGGRGSSSRAVIFGAVAVVAAIAIGVSVAFMGGDKKDVKTGAAGSSSGATTGSSSDSSASPSDSAPPSAAATPVADVSSLQVQNGAEATGVEGTKSSDGKYVTLQQGTTLTWNITAPSAGPMAFWVHYDNPAADARATVTVNGKPHPNGINLKNYAGSNDPAKAWVSSYVWPTFKAGPNTVVLTCDNPACAGLLVDRVALTPTSAKAFPG